MKLINFTDNQANIQFSLDEITTLKNTLNEVCHGIKTTNFENEIGISREQADLILKSIRNLITDEPFSHYHNASNFDMNENLSNNSIQKEKFYLETEGYQIIFYLRNLENLKGYIGIVVVMNINTNIYKSSIKSPAQSISVENLISLVNYFENHINSKKGNCNADSPVFSNCQKAFQIQALSENFSFNKEEKFPLRFMININNQDNNINPSTYVGAEALVTYKSVKSFILSIQSALAKLSLNNK
ncbi:hypothetical protein [Nostoc sp. GT001]|uniref:hypothetical protein n=1 Tax=Nostoc sp. GT001 TaxID=3056647 RepID=UPI0025AB10A2|nr:hypothetical protein [Nostoc sp. GT001]MDM9580201.1 hypothetical protein [Nostoc sp. GT001]